MNRIIRIVVELYLIAFCLMAMVGQAHAQAWSLPDTVKAIAVADAHWPASPCHGHEVIQWTDEATLFRDAHKAYDPQADLYAQAYPDGSCFVQVAWKTVIAWHPSPDYLCALLEHEFGHLAGLGHSTNMHSVMYPDPIDFPWVPHDCAKAFPARQMCRFLNNRHWTMLRIMTADVCLGRPFGGMR